MPRITITAEHLDRVALRYLNRFDSSVANLRRVLNRELRRAERTLGGDGAGPSAASLIDELLERYQKSSLLDDSRYAAAFVSAQRSRGASRQLIAQKLRMRGIASAVVNAALDAADADSSDPDLDAARKFVRKKLLGPHRDAKSRDQKHRRDLAALARAGFSFEVAAKALRVDASDDDVF